MRPSSAAAQEAATAALEPHLGGSTPALQIAQQLFAASDTLADNPKLIAALTDVARPGQQRRQLVARVFAQAHGAVIEALQTLADRSWAAPADMPGVVERLGVRAVVADAAAGQGAERLEQQLFALGEAISDNQQLRRALADRSQSAPAARAQLIEDVFANQLDANTLAVARRAALGVGGAPLAAKLRGYRNQIAEAVGARVATVRSADPLDAAQLERLGRALAGIYGCKMIINVATDPDLVGGMRVSVGSDVYDGTLRSALTDAQRALA